MSSPSEISYRSCFATVNKVPYTKLKIISEAIFTSVARYGIAVYYKPRLHSDPTCEEQTKLQVVQNKMLRLLAGKRLIDKVRLEELAKRYNMMSISRWLPCSS